MDLDSMTRIPPRPVESSLAPTFSQARAGILRRAAVNVAPVNQLPPIVHEVLRSPGQPLDASTRVLMEPRFEHDFSRVRVHTDARAAESARAVNALAYTLGQNAVFGAGQFAPGTTAGKQLLAHELTHVVQQAGGGRQMQGEMTIDQPGDAFEQEADATARRVVAGAQAGEALTSRELAIQRQTPGSETEEKPPEKKEAGEVVAEGMKTVAEQAKDNNSKVKTVLIDPIKDRLKGEWGRLSTGEKATTIGFGAGTLGMAGGALLSDPGGRKVLEGVNLAAPFTLIPYVPLSSFKYTLPKGGGPAERLLKFETDFTADDLINIRTKSRGLPEMSLSVSMQWGYDPGADRLSVLGGNATLGVVPGLSISGGAYKDVLRPPQTFIGPGGGMTEARKSIPEFGEPKPIPDVRVMVTVDLMKFNPGDLVKQIKGLF